MSKYLKVMFGNLSGADKTLEYKIGEVNIADNWNPSAKKGRDFGGFNFSTEDKIIRWLHRGDTIYDVIIPSDAEVVDVVDSATPHGVFRSNKIILKNPRKVTDKMALEFYKKSNIPEIAYYKTLGVVAIMGYESTALNILKDKVNKKNIDIVLEEWNDFIVKRNNKSNELVNIIDEKLYEIKSDLLISTIIDKEPYTKKITNDKVINLTGESGSGKSFYSNKYINNENFIVVDTDFIFNNEPSNDKTIIELRKLFKGKNKDYLIEKFDRCYLTILNYFKDINKTIVIDSAQFRNIKNYTILKGEVIVMRTCIDTCYQRCIIRWKNINKNYTEDDLIRYSNKKLGMYSWYKSLNKFIENVDKL